MQIVPFSANATPRVGVSLAYATMKGVTNPLQLRGVVIQGDFAPIVLCSVDWIGIGGRLSDQFRQALAEAANTTVDRVTVHCVHQHDAPWGNAEIVPILQDAGLEVRFLDEQHLGPIVEDAVRSLELAKQTPVTVTHIGHGAAKVDRIASNRRVLGDDGRVAIVRYSACRNPAGQDAPEGLIDPWFRLVSFWNDDEPVLGLAYYACHPQSYYHTACADADFPGLARQRADTELETKHIYFTGAAGNITAGKWNDGSKKSRAGLTDRLAKAYHQAWQNTQRTSIADGDVQWQGVTVNLPAAEDLEVNALEATLRSTDLPAAQRITAGRKIALLKYHQNGLAATFTRLALGDVNIVHGPSELFVEYQLFAQSLKPDAFVAMAAYGEGSLGYIPTAEAYAQGGYEVKPAVTHVTSDAEAVIKDGLRTLFAQ